MYQTGSGRVGSRVTDLRRWERRQAADDLQTTTDLAVEDGHDDEDADYQRIDYELALEVGTENSTTERMLDDQIEVIACGFVCAVSRNNEVGQSAHR